MSHKIAVIQLSTIRVNSIIISIINEYFNAGADTKALKLLLDIRIHIDGLCVYFYMNIHVAPMSCL